MQTFFDRIQTAAARETMLLRKRLFQLRMRMAGDFHPSSYPYMSSDSFRALAHHAFDTIDEKTRVPRIEAGDIVFVNNKYQREFFERVHPHIQGKYVLISHYDTESIDRSYAGYLDDPRIIRWFGKNAVITHPKLTPIPIGLDNLSLYGTGVTGIFRKLQKKAGQPKKARIFYHFKVATNPAHRKAALEYISRHPFAETMEHKLPPESYMKHLMRYMAVLSPNGAGIECHRTWEALYLGVAPIVMRTAMMDYFASLGVPLWIVDSWTELDGVDEEAIRRKCGELMKARNDEPLYMDYWIEKIQSARESAASALKFSLNPLPKKPSSKIRIKSRNALIRVQSEWRKRSMIAARKALTVTRRFRMPPKTRAYAIAIMCAKRPAYVDLAIDNINSCHRINPHHTFVIYADDICEKAFSERRGRLDYPALTTVENHFGASDQPWQYSKIEMIIDTARKGRISMDADELWHGDISLDPDRITFLAISTVFRDKTTERGVVEHIFKKPEWLDFLHITSGFVSIPPRFMTEALARDMRSFTRAIFNDPALFLPELERPECRRLAEEFAACLAVQANWPQKDITTLKQKDGAKSTEFFQPLYYGCERQITE